MSDADRITLSRSNIVAALEARGKSSFEVSVELGKNRTYIDDYIKGRKASISILFARSLAEFLDIHRSYIEGGRPLPDKIGDAVPARGSEASRLSLEKTVNDLDDQIKLYERGSFGIFGRKIDTESIDDLKAMRDMLTSPTDRSKSVGKLLSDYGFSPHPNAEVGWSVSSVFASKVLNADARKLIVLAIEDNSMKNPVGDGFLHGERLIVDTSRRDFRRGGPFAILHDGVPVIRLIEMVPGIGGEIVIGKPLNTHFPVIDLGATPDEQIIGRVVGQIRPL